MTTITIDRATVEQALEAMDREIDTRRCKASTLRAMIALRAALAQQAEPVEPRRREGDHNIESPFNACMHKSYCMTLKQAEPLEPVAKVELMMTGGNAGLATRIVEIDDHLRERLRPGQLLYTAPPQRKPLTEKEILRVKGQFRGTMNAQFVDFARAIERAHGITGDPK